MHWKIGAALAGALFAASAFASQAAADASGIVGRWVTEGGKSHIQIYECGAHLCGRIVWLREPNFKNGAHAGQPLMDTRNPDASRRSRPILGLTMMWNLAKSDEPGTWEGGRLYNPEDGEVYKGTMRLRPDGKLTVRGYIGISLLGKSQTWERVK
jgi:uncharacterized protein (DUF2147 family)